MQITNTFWFRHFLLCNQFAKILCRSQGWDVHNFAKLILEEAEGVWANAQMTKYFWAADFAFCEITESQEGIIFDELDDKCVSIQTLASLTKEELQGYYEHYCVGAIYFSLTTK